MSCEFIRSRDALHERLGAVIDEFYSLYPDVHPPKLFKGFPVGEPPFYIAVDEMVPSATSAGAASIGQDSITWTLGVWAFTKHANLITASDALLTYIDMIFSVVAADPTLGRCVDNAFPAIEVIGTSRESGNYYISAAQISIECTAEATCPPEIRQIVRAMKE